MSSSKLEHRSRLQPAMYQEPRLAWPRVSAEYRALNKWSLSARTPRFNVLLLFRSVSVNTYRYGHLLSWIRPFMHTYVPTHIHVHIHVHTHTRIYVDIYTCIYVDYLLFLLLLLTSNMRASLPRARPSTLSYFVAPTNSLRCTGSVAIKSALHLAPFATGQQAQADTPSCTLRIWRSCDGRRATARRCCG